MPNFKECQCAKPCRKSCQNCGWMRTPEVILEIRKKPDFSRWSTTLLFTSFSNKLLTTKKTNIVVVFSCRCIPNILKYCDQEIKRSRFIETQIEKFSWYIWKFRFTVLQNCHWNTMKTRNLWVIKVGHDPT